MCQESTRIPVDVDTREVFAREIDGQRELVLVDHEGREQAVPVRMQPVAKERKAA